MDEWATDEFSYFTPILFSLDYGLYILPRDENNILPNIMASFFVPQFLDGC